MSTNQSSASFDCFTIEQVKEINKIIKENILEEENSSLPADNANKKGKFYIFPCDPLIQLLHPFLYNCQGINRNYYSYDINWHFHIEVLSYNVYGVGDKYGWHIDQNPRNVMFTPKLTCLLNLSEEPYEGGDLHIVGSDEKQKFNSSGSAIVFTSLLSHKVTPVTKGERITLTYWASGPTWR